MAADQDRAARIRELKEAHQELTWQAIADHVGVTMRAAQAWAEKGEIAYANAKKLAELFPDEVDVDWIMRGPQTAPDLMGAVGRLERIERLLGEVLSRLPDPAAELERESTGAHPPSAARGADSVSAARSSRRRAKAP